MSPSIETQQLPDYDEELSLYHHAFASELEIAIEDLPLPPGATVLDIPCGDGFYTRLLGDRLGDNATVIASDLSPAYLRKSRKAVRDVAAKVEIVQADAYRLGFDDNSFEAVWCAQSFISLERPLAALREFRRVLRPGGFVAVLECDEFHHVVLPWPAEFELRLQAALQDACRDHYGSATKTYISRRMRRWLRTAGFDPVQRASYTADRSAPLDADTRRYLDVYLREYADFVRDFLSPNDRELLQRLTDPQSPEYLPQREDFDMTCMFTVWCGTGF
jgi:ubiquinone/menaquinone biosynthesis C-methylase UbiE